MNVSYLKMDDLSVLGERVLNLINNRHVVCIRDFPSDKHKVAELWWKIGNPISVNDTSFHENIEIMKNVNDDKWYNQSDGLPMHIDGLISHVNGTHPWLPMTALYANDLTDVQGGGTFIYDMVNLYEIHGSDTLKPVQIAFQHPTLPGAQLVRDVPLMRRDRYTMRWYPLIDDWFYRFVERDVDQRSEHIKEFMEKIQNDPYERYDHVWKPRDMLIWTNEGFLHGRTPITGGNREMWRGIIRDREPPRTRFYPRDTENEARHNPSG